MSQDARTVNIRCGQCRAQPKIGAALPDESVAGGWEIRVVTRSGTPRRYGGTFVPDDEHRLMRRVEVTGRSVRKMAELPDDLDGRSRRFRCPCGREVVRHVSELCRELRHAATTGELLI